jgi:glutamate--cysteine ligase catalytic subunit
LPPNNTTTNDNDFRTNQFENIQSTVWQSMRFKPPPNSNPHAHTGWRVEFRTMELQVTDFENAALVTFLVLLSRAILAFDLDMLVPISRVDENMKRAQMRGACLNQKFFFKSASSTSLSSSSSPTSGHHIKEMTLNEIMNDAEFGLIRIVRDYLDMYCGDMDAGVRVKVDAYLKLIENKANGKCKTSAAWMRDFVVNHKLYACDSIVSEEIAYDLMWELWQISNGLFECPELNGI